MTDGLENAVVGEAPEQPFSTAPETANAPEQKSHEQTSTEEPAPEQTQPEQNANGAAGEPQPAPPSEDQPAKHPEPEPPVENGGTTTVAASKDSAPSNKREHADIDASGENTVEEPATAADEPSPKKQKIEEAPAALPNGEKKRGRGRPKKVEGSVSTTTKSAPKPPVGAVANGNGEKRGRGRPRKGEEKTPKPVREAAKPSSVGVGSRTRSRATVTG